MSTNSSALKDEAARLDALVRLEAVTRASEAGFEKLTGLVQLTLGTEMASISLIDADTQILKARQGLDLAQCSRGDAFCNIAIQSYEPLVIQDTLEDERVRNNPFVIGPPYLRSYIGAPLTTSDGYNLGTICAFDSKPRLFGRRESQIIRKCADLVMNQLELRSQADTDFLTEVYNRRSFMSELTRELGRRRRTPGSSVIAFIDIDHFKRVNDTFGHPIGDRVLREFADAVTLECRGNDMVARLGGEEFAVLLPDTELDAARVWAERTRMKVARTRFGGSDTLKLTVSIGLVAIDQTDPTIELITKMADAALYEAKHLGRNRVVVKLP